jgi:RNA polymerase sigma-70 factor (ECF subfamily)
VRRGPDPHEHRLARRVAAGDDAAFAELYRRYGRRVRSYVGAALRDADAAQDAAQEVFERMYAGLPHFQPRPGTPLWAWVFGIAGNVVNEERRRRRRTQPWDPAWIAEHRDRSSEAREPYDELTWGAWALRELAPQVRQLPPPQAEAFLLVAILGYRPAEAARIMGRTPADVRQLKHRALTRLSQRGGGRHFRSSGRYTAVLHLRGRRTGDLRHAGMALRS